MTRMTSRQRTILAGGAIAVLGVLLTGCAPASAPATDDRTAPVDPETAKQQLIDAVTDVTTRLGGDWARITGPDYPEDCRLPDGTAGAHWAYLVRRDAAGDADHDTAVLTELWEANGMTIDRWGSGDHVEIVGRGGGATSTIGLTAWGERYSVEGTSLCFPGDPDEL